MLIHKNLDKSENKRETNLNKMKFCYWHAFLTINADMIRILRETTNMWFQDLININPNGGTGNPKQVRQMNWLRLLQLIHLYSINQLSGTRTDVHPY